jgi:hypothetical protein
MSQKIIIRDRVSGEPVAHLDPKDILPPVQLVENLWLSVAPNQVAVDPNRKQPLWIVEFYPYKRRLDIESEKADGWVYASIEKPDDRLSPEAWEDTRLRWAASEEESQTWAQYYLGVQLAALFPSVTNPKPSDPRTLKELAAWFLDKNPDSQNAPEFALLIDEHFEQSNPPASTVWIHLDVISVRCHNAAKTDVETIRRTTYHPIKVAFREFDLPYFVRLKGNHAVISKIR